MADIDDFAIQLFDEAKRFLEKAQACDVDAAGREAFLHASLNLGFCALEAHLNAIADDFATIQDLSLQDKSLMFERRIELIDGKFELSEQLQMYRLWDRLLFFGRRFSGETMDTSSPFWGELKNALNIRNDLTHPKVKPEVTIESVQRALAAILETLDVLYHRVYRKGYPSLRRGLASNMSF
jgi:hypothetical protein